MDTNNSNKQVLLERQKSLLARQKKVKAQKKILLLIKFARDTEKLNVIKTKLYA